MNAVKILELQKISKAYTREKMFQFNEERADIMEARDRFLNSDDENEFDFINELVASKS